MSNDRPVISKQLRRRRYQIFAGWDESERQREGRDGRIYTSCAPRRVFLCTLLDESGEVGGENFDLRRDAVAMGEEWLRN